jgi:hypothetical protein
VITTEEIRQMRTEMEAEQGPGHQNIDKELLLTLALSLVNQMVATDPLTSLTLIIGGLEISMEVGWRIGRKQMLAELTKVKEEQ